MPRLPATWNSRASCACIGSSRPPPCAIRSAAPPRRARPRLPSSPCGWRPWSRCAIITAFSSTMAPGPRRSARAPTWSRSSAGRMARPPAGPTPRSRPRSVARDPALLPSLNGGIAPITPSRMNAAKTPWKITSSPAGSSWNSTPPRAAKPRSPSPSATSRPRLFPPMMPRASNSWPQSGNASLPSLL